MKRIRRIVAWVLAVVLGVALVVGAAFVVSPVPSIMLFRNAFKEGHPVEPPRFDEVRRTVQVTRDQEYPSSYRRHTFDLYRPRRIPAHAALPVIVWVHGGGFIAGDKSGLSTYATLMAARGYAVIAMNYDYAPTGTYPTPVVQLGQMVSHVASIAQRERLDPDRIVVGGDSAGAQIAAQFAAVQTTPGYAESSGIERIAMRAPLAGALLFCGPYDFTRFTDANAPWIQRWFMNTIGWGYLGTRDWASSPQMRQASVVRHVSDRFPKAYVVDGNAFSFPDQGRALVSALRSDGVGVTSSFFPGNPELPHEFQFDFAHPESAQVWSATQAFLASVAPTPTPATAGQ